MADDMAADHEVPQGFDPNMIGKLRGDADDKQAEGGKTVQFVSFKVDDSEYGVDIMAVREIQGWVQVTKLPNTPQHVRGVLNLRGIIVPIFDLRCRFGNGLTEATDLHVMIILSVGERIMGLLVDAVSDILTVSTEEILPVPEIESRSDQRFLNGLITVQERMVALLEIEKLFDIDDLVAQVTSAAE